jgi:hypothetical protein
MVPCKVFASAPRDCLASSSFSISERADASSAKVISDEASSWSSLVWTSSAARDLAFKESETSWSCEQRYISSLCVPEKETNLDRQFRDYDRLSGCRLYGPLQLKPALGMSLWVRKCKSLTSPSSSTNASDFASKDSVTSLSYMRGERQFFGAREERLAWILINVSLSSLGAFEDSA